MPIGIDQQETFDCIDAGLRVAVASGVRLDARDLFLEGFVQSEIAKGRDRFRAYSEESKTSASEWVESFLSDRKFTGSLQLGGTTFSIDAAPMSDNRFIVAGRNNEYSIAKITQAHGNTDISVQVFLEEETPLLGDRILESYETEGREYGLITTQRAKDAILCVMALYAAGSWRRDI